MKKEIAWLKTIVPEKLDWVKNAVYNEGRYTLDQFIDIWLSWLIQHEFVKVFGDCEGYIILRPVPIKWVFETDIDYFKMLFSYYSEGDTVWIDSIWAPGRFNEVHALLRATRRKFVAWEHGSKLRCMPIKDLHGDFVSVDQIRDSLVRSF